ncbi:class I SAM-dependent methyltransferase [uncultured Draconibacterium sp.]|uniref:class I SAM-dependent methyltransferase n=1 Tax=uncultured Draconibacterium sp. TaxID=1573823 RepID=UPI002AA63CE7|nr:class I SAM-dependent methyltransferase [uncultured Draconibacterium sp.]
MEQKIKETYWSRFSEDYEEKQQNVVGKELLSLTREEMLKESDLGKILELGCGTGLYTEILLKNSKIVVATDFSDEMVATAKQKRGNLQKVQFKRANALNLDFENESFDTVFMANLIHIIGNAEKVIQESKRVLKSGGCLIITSFAIDDMNFFSRMAIGIRYIKTFGKPSDEALKEKNTKKSVESLLVKNGFEISKSVMLGKKSKAFYITSIKN